MPWRPIHSVGAASVLRSAMSRSAVLSMRMMSLNIAALPSAVRAALWRIRAACSASSSITSATVRLHAEFLRDRAHRHVHLERHLALVAHVQFAVVVVLVEHRDQGGAHPDHDVVVAVRAAVAPRAAEIVEPTVQLRPDLRVQVRHGPPSVPSTGGHAASPEIATPT